MIKKDEISSFFNNILKSDLNEKFKDSILKSDYKLSRNILYLTNQCNIDCDYCYQKEDREKSKSQFISKEEINSYFYNLLEREPNQNSVVVLFGGEPFLNYKMIEYIFDLTASITEKFGKRFNIGTITNGIYFLDNEKFLKFIERVSKLKNNFSIDISYDGCGHDRRIYKNGKSTKEDVKNVIKKFTEKEYKNLNVGIRYTIHKDNYKDCLSDLVKLSKLNIDKIFVNFFEMELDCYIDSNILKSDLKSKTCDIFKVFKTPICHLNCKVCKRCNFEEFSDKIHYGFNKEFIVCDEKAGEFNHFSDIQSEKCSQNCKCKGE